MSDPLADAKWRLATAFDQHCEVGVEAFRADQWVANSLLQKSIRRGEIDVAQRAALTFLAQRGSAIWRRFMIVAFEDVGAASPAAVATTVAASTDAPWRKMAGGDVAVALHLARLLAEAPKSRSAEHLITTANHHPSLESERVRVSNRLIEENLAAVEDSAQPLAFRALAAKQVSGIGRTQGKTSESDLRALLTTYRQLGVPEELVAATEIATARVRDPITLMVPLICLAANDGQVPTVTNSEVPRSLCFDDIPMYALDKHTRVGREAIRNLIKFNFQIRDCLKRYVASRQWSDAAYMAAFYADAAPLARKLVWRGADELEALGTEADLLRAGVAAEGIAPLLELFRANVGHLNKVRAHTLGKKLGFIDVAEALLADVEGRK